MNVFVLDEDPARAAVYHNDTHVRKMILEAAQMLSTAVRINNPGKDPGVYKIAYPKHPCTLKCINNRSNFRWVLELAENLAKEYEFRFDKSHASARILPEIRNHIDSIPCGPLEFAQAMPDKYKNQCPVTAYRTYYKNEKIYMKNGKCMVVYTRRTTPEFLHENVQNIRDACVIFYSIYR